ncbi:Hypp4575 [Branchiostoma lanceolatum]|uniref:Hypp4575 protein n=1 Tax=Branchiostoma lanceolatum TaxID=7740 RepID=A0A8K0A8U8_BRALA|nr:Hypp4575 [Branchiostoma lanceolatum]
MTTESKEEVRGVEQRMKSEERYSFSPLAGDPEPSSQCDALLELTQQQAKVSEDDLARSSFKIAELEILLADYKLELFQSRADLVTAMCELHQEKSRSSQKNRQINDLRAQVTALKAGGDCLDCQDEVQEAQELSEFRISELEVLLEEQRNENTLLRAQLLSEKEKSLTAGMLSSSSAQGMMGNSGGLCQSVLKKAEKMFALTENLSKSSVPRKHEKVFFKFANKFFGLVVTVGSKMYLKTKK